MPLTRPLLVWLKSLCSTSLCRTDQALAVFSDWDSTGMRTHPPPPSRSSGAGGVGQGGRPHRPPGAQQGPPSLTVGWGWRGVKRSPSGILRCACPPSFPSASCPPLSVLSRGSTHRRPRRQRRRSRVLTAASQMATRTASARHADRPAGEWTRPRHPLVLSLILPLPGGLRSLAFQAPLTHRMEDPTCPRPPTPPPAHPAVVVRGTRLPVGGGVGLRGQPPDTHSAARPSGRCAGSPGRAERGR